MHEWAIKLLLEVGELVTALRSGADNGLGKRLAWFEVFLYDGMDNACHRIPEYGKS